MKQIKVTSGAKSALSCQHAKNPGVKSVVHCLKAIVLVNLVLIVTLLLSPYLMCGYSATLPSLILPSLQSPLSDYTLFDYSSFNTRVETVKRLTINYPLFGVRINYNVTFNATTPDIEPNRLKAIIKMRNATSLPICGLDIVLFKTNIIDVDYVNGNDSNSAKIGGCDYYAGMVIQVFYDGADLTVRDCNNASNVFASVACANFTLRAIEASGENDSTTAGYAEAATDIETLQAVPISAKGASFLVNYTYNSTLELCSEEPRGYQYANRFWICSDNLLAYYALQQYDQTISNDIKNKIQEYVVNYSLPHDSRGLPISYKHEPIVGDVLPEGMPHNPNYYSLKHPPSYEVATEVNNNDTWTFWPSFADILAWKGMSYLNQGNNESALRCYEAMMNMWDGYGFADAHYFDINCASYDPFKVALAIILRQRLILPKPVQEYEMDDILLACQQPDGGIATGYDRHLNTAGHVENTETTSLVVIANVTELPAPSSLLMPPKPSLGTFAFYYPWYGNSSDDWHDWHDAGHNPNNTIDGRSDIAATDYPSLGAYDSNDETVIDQHVQWAKMAGVDCFIISWWGINSFSDNASKHIKNVCERDNFKFTFYIENTSENYNDNPSINQTTNDITYLLNTYGNSSSFCKIDGRPVIFVYAKARDSLNSEAWVWHACTDSIGNDTDPGTNESASTQWLPAEEVRVPPRLGIVPFEPFKTTPGYVESASPIPLQPNEQYWLNVSVSDIRNDSGTNSTVGIEIKIGTDPTCNDTLYNQTLHFSDGWQDLSFNVTSYAGQDVYLRAESYNLNWSSEWAAVDYFYITNSNGTIVSPDPFLDNGWNETIYELRAKGYNPYVIMDFGGYESKLQGFIEYFSDCIDGIHIYNPLDLSNNTMEALVDAYDLYQQACELAHSYDETFIATVMPGFDNTAISGTNGSETLKVVDRSDGACYRLFWLIANASHPDGYAITSFNEWHEGTEIEPSIEYRDLYLNLTRDNMTYTVPEFSPITLLPFMVVTPLVVIVCRRKHNERRLRTE